MHSLTFTPSGTSSVKGIWMLSRRVNHIWLRRTPPTSWSYHSIQRHLLEWSKQKASTLRACSAWPFALHLVQTSLAQLIRVPPRSCKHAHDDLRLGTTLRTRHIHPSIHSSSPCCRCLLLGMWESLKRRQGLVSPVCDAADSFQMMFTVTLHNDSHIVCKPDSSAV